LNNNLGDQLYNTTFSIFQKVQAMNVKKCSHAPWCFF
jgi:hypothetical protein